MRKPILGVLALALFSTSALAADTASHTVTVTVAAVNEVAIVGGNVSQEPRRTNCIRSGVMNQSVHRRPRSASSFLPSPGLGW